LLEPAAVPVKRPRVHHLRTWYALADLLDRAGDSSRARRLFQQIRAVDSDFADVEARLSALGR
jgi:Flp pilus assembly protein TadD